MAELDALRRDRRPNELPELASIVRRYDDAHERLEGSAAADWGSLEDRMSFIVDLFRSRQKSLELFDRSFLCDQGLEMAANRIPTGPCSGGGAGVRAAHATDLRGAAYRARTTKPRGGAARRPGRSSPFEPGARARRRPGAAGELPAEVTVISSLRSFATRLPFVFALATSAVACVGAPPDPIDADEEMVLESQDPLILGDGEGGCTLQIVCNRSCLSFLRAQCQAECGTDSACGSACLNDARGSCCDERCN